MTGLDSYHSQYPMNYYEEGVAYAFYHHVGINRLEKTATDEQLSKGAEALATARANFGFEADERVNGVAFSREIGVVVGKRKASEMNPEEVIVLFEKDGNYYTRRYAVNVKSVFFNDKEWSIAKPGKNIIPIEGSEETEPIAIGETEPVVIGETEPVVIGETEPVVK